MSLCGIMTKKGENQPFLVVHRNRRYICFRFCLFLIPLVCQKKGWFYVGMSIFQYEGTYVPLNEFGKQKIKSIESDFFRLSDKINMVSYSKTSPESLLELEKRVILCFFWN